MAHDIVIGSVDQSGAIHDIIIGNQTAVSLDVVEDSETLVAIIESADAPDGQGRMISQMTTSNVGSMIVPLV